ncbi:MAG: hypothetical protein OXR66_05575 [Candidatus Woesearchaeota archaeon]|nr:hypothetical protein [Candidatus Woesearchaeota archaeon]
MGFGSIATQMVLFIAMVTIAASLVMHMRVFTGQATASIAVQKDRLVEELKTDVTITSLSFSNLTDPHTATIYVKNTGKIKLKLNATDLYIDGSRYTTTERNISIENDTEVNNPLIWDPSEVVKIEGFRNLSGGLHTARVVTDNGVSDEDTFST